MVTEWLSALLLVSGSGVPEFTDTGFLRRMRENRERVTEHFANQPEPVLHAATPIPQHVPQNPVPGAGGRAPDESR